MGDKWSLPARQKRKENRIKITHLGCPGHFVNSEACLFRMHTQVGTSYRVSTIGDYRPRGSAKTVSLGPEGMFYETKVFRTSRPDPGGCGCFLVSSWSEVDSKSYGSAAEANDGHEAMVRRVASILRKKRKEAK